MLSLIGAVCFFFTSEFGRISDSFSRPSKVITSAFYTTIVPLIYKQQPKSEIAAKAVREMNAAMNITAHQNRLDAESEAVYDSDFFLRLDGVAAALDNVEASEHICPPLLFALPFFHCFSFDSSSRVFIS